MSRPAQPVLLILNQMAGPLTRELAEDLAREVGPIALLTGHPDTLAAGGGPELRIDAAAPYARGSYVRRVVSWLTYLGQAWRWLGRHDRSIPLLVFSNPPLAPWLARLRHALYGTPYSVMVHDVYPDLLVGLGKLGPRNPLLRAWRALNRRAYEQAELVMTLGEAMAARLARQFDPARTPASRIEIIPPWADTRAIHPRDKSDNWFAREHGLEGRATIMYSGNMGVGHDLETLLDAAARLRGREDLRFVLIGAGPKWSWVDETIRERRLDNVTLLGWQPEDVLPFSLASADAAVVSLESGLDGVAIPSKAFSFLAAGAALVAVADPQGELGALVRRHDCGWSVRPGALDELSRVLDEIAAGGPALERRRRNSRAAAERVGSRANSRRIVDLLRRHHGLFVRPTGHAEAERGSDPAERAEAAQVLAGHP